MLIIGCDYHPSFQQISFVDTQTGDCGERRLKHKEEAEQFYRDLHARGMKVRIGLEASGYTRWFERLIEELGLEFARIVSKRASLAHLGSYAPPVGSPNTQFTGRL